MFWYALKKLKKRSAKRYLFWKTIFDIPATPINTGAFEL